MDAVIYWFLRWAVRWQVSFYISKLIYITHLLFHVSDISSSLSSKNLTAFRDTVSSFAPFRERGHKTLARTSPSFHTFSQLLHLQISFLLASFLLFTPLSDHPLGLLAQAILAGSGTLKNTQAGPTQFPKTSALVWASSLTGWGEAVGQQAPSMAGPRHASADRPCERF